MFHNSLHGQTLNSLVTFVRSAVSRFIVLDCNSALFREMHSIFFIYFYCLLFALLSFWNSRFATINLILRPYQHSYMSFCFIFKIIFINEQTSRAPFSEQRSRAFRLCASMALKSSWHSIVRKSNHCACPNFGFDTIDRKPHTDSDLQRTF